MQIRWYHALASGVVMAVLAASASNVMALSSGGPDAANGLGNINNINDGFTAGNSDLAGASDPSGATLDSGGNSNDQNIGIGVAIGLSVFLAAVLAVEFSNQHHHSPAAPQHASSGSSAPLSPSTGLLLNDSQFLMPTPTPQFVPGDGVLHLDSAPPTVPEPGSVLLLMLALAGIWVRAGRRV